MSEPMLVTGGLQTLEPEPAALLRLLDRHVEEWGLADGAESMIMSPLLTVADLAGLDVYDNFPHQALVACALDLGQQDGTTRRGESAFSPASLLDARLALPTAACFAVYLHLRGRSVPDRLLVTVLGRCFRRESAYDGLRRLLGFHMREVVAIGTRETVTEHLRIFGERIAAFAAALDLPVRKDVATDPFYDRGGQRAQLQRLSPVKHEFLVGDLAIASTNVHRNFFGERCEIRLADGAGWAFTGCVAFGLERWLAVLFDRYGSWARATEAVARVRTEVMSL